MVEGGPGVCEAYRPQCLCGVDCLYVFHFKVSDRPEISETVGPVLGFARMTTRDVAKTALRFLTGHCWYPL